MQNHIKYAYIFVDKNKIDECCKYGMKLSVFNNIDMSITGTHKKGIEAFLSPKDSEKYHDKDFEILRVKLNNKAYVINELNEDEYCKLENYDYGKYMCPKIFITSSIMPENIFKYNRILDVPLIIQNSKEFFLEREEENINEAQNANYTFNDIKEYKSSADN